MTKEELEIAIFEGISRIYCARYCGLLQVKEIYDCGYTNCCLSDNGHIVGYELVLGLNVADKPIRIAVNGTQEDFLRYVLKEIRVRRLDLAKYFTGYQSYKSDSCPGQDSPDCSRCDTIKNIYRE